MRHDSTKAFGGAPLCGDRALKWAHLDEAGTSAKEQCCVVAGIVSSPDGQWRQLNKYLDDLRGEFASGQPEIIFHAKDIWHGTKNFHRDRWPRDRRVALLYELAKIPRIFQLPVIGAAVQKDKHNWNFEDGSHPNRDSWCYALAFGMCVINFESYMRELSDDREVGTVIAEDNTHMRRYAQFGFNTLLQNVDRRESINARYLPIQRVVEQPLFTEKRGSALLQISDTLAFLLGRHRNGHSDADAFIHHFSNQIYELPHQRQLMQ